MARQRDPNKWQQWRQRLRRFEQSDLSIEQFCIREGVSTASFYQWRRRLATNDRPATASPSPSANAKPPAFVELRWPAAPLELHLPGGAKLLIPRGDLAALQAALEAVGQSNHEPSQESASC